MRKLMYILICNWLLVGSAPTTPQIIYGQFIEEKSCITTRDDWQKQETRPGVQWACLLASDFNTIATPKVPAPPPPAANPQPSK